MAPDGADFLAADGLPDVLTVLNGGAVEQHAAIGGDHLGGDGRCVVQNLDADAAQDRERDGHYQTECDPEFLVVHR